MPRGDSLLRQWELIKALQANRFGLSTEELCDRLECNKRTVQRDLGVLQDLFPINHEQRDRGKRFWKLAPNTIESNQLQLTMTEMLSLFLSQQLLLPLAGTQFGDGLQTAMQKVRAVLPAKALTYFESLDGAFFIKSLAQHDYSGQDKEIRILNEAILNHKVVKIVYRSASKALEVTSEFDPYGMVLLHASLYCIGYLACYNEVRTLKIARIKGITRLDKSFEKPSDFSLAGHLQGAFGVFRTQKVQSVKVEFTRGTQTSTRNWFGAARMSRTGPTSSSTRRRSTSRKRSTPRCWSTTFAASPRPPASPASSPRASPARFQSSSTSSPTSTASPRAPTRPTSTSTTRTGVIA
jgi:predicted DNA-binding transcriptional regulator YafY